MCCSAVVLLLALCALGLCCWAATLATLLWAVGDAMIHDSSLTAAVAWLSRSDPRSCRSKEPIHSPTASIVASPIPGCQRRFGSRRSSAIPFAAFIGASSRCLGGQMLSRKQIWRRVKSTRRRREPATRAYPLPFDSQQSGGGTVLAPKSSLPSGSGPRDGLQRPEHQLEQPPEQRSEKRRVRWSNKMYVCVIPSRYDLASLGPSLHWSAGDIKKFMQEAAKEVRDVILVKHVSRREALALLYQPGGEEDVESLLSSERVDTAWSSFLRRSPSKVDLVLPDTFEVPKTDVELNARENDLLSAPNASNVPKRTPSGDAAEKDKFWAVSWKPPSEASSRQVLRRPSF